MSASPRYKVYMGAKNYRASFKCAAEAAMFVGCLGDGATVRFDHREILWREGSETQSASESYDFAAEVMLDRLNAANKRVSDRRARMRDRLAEQSVNTKRYATVHLTADLMPDANQRREWHGKVVRIDHAEGSSVRVVAFPGGPSTVLDRRALRGVRSKP